MVLRLCSTSAKATFHKVGLVAVTNTQIRIRIKLLLSLSIYKYFGLFTGILPLL